MVQPGGPQYLGYSQGSRQHVDGICARKGQSAIGRFWQPGVHVHNATPPGNPAIVSHQIMEWLRKPRRGLDP